jgi:hypothetical protein
VPESAEAKRGRVHPYNLTPRQRELLGKMVGLVRSGTGREPFLAIGQREGYTLLPAGGGEGIAITEGWEGDLDALVEADLLSARWNSTGKNRLYTIKQAGYEAIDARFAAPDTSFLKHLTPLADLTNFDPDIKSRCLPILGAGSADPKLWDSAVRTAGVILEERLRAVGNISDPTRNGRDLVNDAFRQSGTLACKFTSDSERQGFRDLFAGVVGAFRNPYAHRLVDPLPADGGAFIVFVNLLLKVLDDLVRTP